jgi:hypothetical protein
MGRVWLVSGHHHTWHVAHTRAADRRRVTRIVCDTFGGTGPDALGAVVLPAGRLVYAPKVE